VVEGGLEPVPGGIGFAKRGKRGPLVAGPDASPFGVAVPGRLAVWGRVPFGIGGTVPGAQPEGSGSDQSPAGAGPPLGAGDGGPPEPGPEDFAGAEGGGPEASPDVPGGDGCGAG
jgi:hypothetical protein